MLPVPVTPGPLPVAPEAPVRALVADPSGPLVPEFVADPVSRMLLPFPGKIPEGPAPPPIAGPPLPVWASPLVPTASPA